MKALRPTHRAIIDRRTGQMAGPFVPIGPQDWPYSSIHPSETLWRYMDFWKFETLLHNSALYFSRPDKFDDSFEGRFMPANLTTMSASDAAFYAAYRLDLSSEQVRQSQEVMRRCVFICCWRRASMESREMWHAYTSGPESVVITSSAKALAKFLPQKILQSPVKYHREDYARTAFDNLSIFFYKPRQYDIEREFRLLLVPDGPIKLVEIGRLVPIRLNKIVHRVITHPKASKEFKARVAALVGQHITRIKAENSAFLP